MKTDRFVCLCCLGIDGAVIDRICDDFDIDFDKDDVMEAVRNGINIDWGPGMYLLQTLFGKIIEQYGELDKNKFDYDFSSPSFPCFYYDHRQFSTKEDLDAIAGRE